MREMQEANASEGSACEEHRSVPVLDTECVLDTVRAVDYLGQAVVYIYRATVCPDGAPLGCAAPVGDAIQAFIWVAAFVASAAETCGHSLTGPGPECARDILRDMAAGGSVVFGIEEDCYLTDTDETAFRVFSGRRRSQGVAGGLALWGGAARGSPPAARSKSHFQHFDDILREKRLPANATTELRFDRAQCTFDVLNAASWLGQAALQIRKAALCCPRKEACAMSTVYVLAALSYAAQFMSLAANDCPFKGSREALCGGDVADTVGSLAMTAVSSARAIDFCAEALHGP